MTAILGLSAYYHDSAACLLVDGEIVAAAQEERFTRRKGDASFPARAVAYCLEEGGLNPVDLDFIAFYDKPLLKFERILETYLGIAPRGARQFLQAGPVWIKEKLFTDRGIREELGGYEGEILYSEHHEAHAASAFFPSPFEEAAILTVDGVGEWATASIGVGRSQEMELLRELHWPDSLGLLYSAFTYHAGFKVNSGEYKLMGLAPYGTPRYMDRILSEVVELRDDGSFRLEQRYFDYLGGLTMTSPAFSELFDGPPRAPEAPMTQRELDLARSVQVVCEEVILRMAATAHRLTGLPDLCMAGGVALNCVANGRLLREGPFRRVWVQPAAGDAGGALGVAKLAYHRHCEKPRVVNSGDAMRGALLGPAFDPERIESFLDGVGAQYQRMERDALLERTAEALAGGAAVGWFAGRMEFGPRALGSRSILGDPRDPTMQSRLNLKIKFRESFRPFAPSVLREHVGDYFDLDADSPYMLFVAPLQEARRRTLTDAEQQRWGIDLLNTLRSDIPAVTHVDYSARVQTVHCENNPDYYDLIRAFGRRTGCHLLVNTSFNVRGEPLVCTPEDAYRCFMRTDLDHLVLWPYFLDKSEQPPWQDDGETFELD